MMTQGRGDGTEWVTSFMVSFSMDAFHWQYVSDLYSNQRVSTRIVEYPSNEKTNKSYILIILLMVWCTKQRN